MAELNFNTPVGSVVARKLLILYLNTGTEAAPIWSPVGKRVEDSSAEYDWGEETKTDIFGKTYTTLKLPTVTQTFDPGELDAEDVAQKKIWNMAINEQDTAALSNQDMLVVHAYAGEDDAVFAERYKSCAIKPSGLGGASNVAMPVDVTYGGERVVGTAATGDTGVVFTPAA